MAYTRHTWQSGEVISSVLLNNIEDGIEEAASSGGGSERFIIECTENSDGMLTHNVTFQEAYDAFESGKEIWLKINTNNTNGSSRIRFQQVEQGNNVVGFVGVAFTRNGYDIFMFIKDNEVTTVKYTINGSSTPEPIIFNATFDSKTLDIGNISCNYTYEQINEMSQNPTTPLTAIMITKDTTGNTVETLSGFSLSETENVEQIDFSKLEYGQTSKDQYSLRICTITYNSDGSINFSVGTIMTNTVDSGGQV